MKFVTGSGVSQIHKVESALYGPPDLPVPTFPSARQQHAGVHGDEVCCAAHCSLLAAGQKDILTSGQCPSYLIPLPTLRGAIGGI